MPRIARTMAISFFSLERFNREHKGRKNKCGPYVIFHFSLTSSQIIFNVGFFLNARAIATSFFELKKNNNGKHKYKKRIKKTCC